MTNKMTITIDLNQFPAVFDQLHVGLIGLLILLLVTLLAMLKKSRRVIAQPLPVATAAKQDISTTLQLLTLLQREARFIDFIEENVAAYSDAEIGVAARVVHEGCRKVIKDCFQLEPIRSEAEGSRVLLPKDFDASAIRLSGNLVGAAPFNGTLLHRGWRVTGVKLPQVLDGHDLHILAAAEVEL